MTTTTTNQHHSSPPQLPLPLITRLKLFLLRHLPAAPQPHRRRLSFPSRLRFLPRHHFRRQHQSLVPPLHPRNQNNRFRFRLFSPRDRASSRRRILLLLRRPQNVRRPLPPPRLHPPRRRRLRQLPPRASAQVPLPIRRQIPSPRIPRHESRLHRFVAKERRSRPLLPRRSAGGNLAHNLAIRVAGEGKFEEVKVIGLVLIQPFFGGVDRVESEIRFRDGPILNVDRNDGLWRAVLGDGLDRDYWAVKVSEPNAVELDGPVEGLAAVSEWLKGKEKSVELVDLPGAFHGFYAFPEMEEYGQLIAAIKGFVEKHSS